MKSTSPGPGPHRAGPLKQAALLNAESERKYDTMSRHDYTKEAFVYIRARVCVSIMLNNLFTRHD